MRMAMDVKGITLKWYPVSATDGRIGLLGRASSDVEFGGGDCVIASSWQREELCHHQRPRLEPCGQNESDTQLL